MSVRQRSTVAESSALLKATLRKAFLATKFSVRLSRGTGYGNCYVSWSDGPTARRVDAILADFEGKGFDGSTDSSYYKHAIMPNGERSALGLILRERTISAPFARKLAQAVSAYWGGEDMQPPEIISTGRYWSILDGQNGNSRERTGRDWQELIYRAGNDRLTVTHA